MEGTFEEKVQGTLLFVRNSTEPEIAEFIVYQNDAVDGLRKNLEAYTKEFRIMYNNRIHKDAQKDAHYALGALAKALVKYPDVGHGYMQ